MYISNNIHMHAFITGTFDIDYYLLFGMLDYKAISILNIANKYLHRNTTRWIASDKYHERYDFTSKASLTDNAIFVNNRITKRWIMTDDKYNTICLSLACNSGFLSLAKWIVNVTNIRVVDNSFATACYFGHMNTVKWIYDHSCKRIRDFPFVMACAGGQTHIAKWLIGIMPTINVNMNGNQAFTRACANGHLDTAVWLFDHPKHSIGVSGLQRAFVCAVSQEHGDVAKWIYGIADGMINIGDALLV